MYVLFIEVNGQKPEVEIAYGSEGGSAASVAILTALEAINMKIEVPEQVIILDPNLSERNQAFAKVVEKYRSIVNQTYQFKMADVLEESTQHREENPEPMEEPEPVEESEPGKEPEPVKEPESTEESEPGKKYEPVKEPEPMEESEPVKKSEPMKESEPEPMEESEPGRESEDSQDSKKEAAKISDEQVSTLQFKQD